MDGNVARTSRAARLALLALIALTLLVAATPIVAQAAAGGEVNLQIPPLDSVQVAGMNGRVLLMFGLGVCVLGLVFGLVIYRQLKNLPVHASMREISELIYETCKTYLITQGKFILLLEIFIGAIIVLYFGFLLGFLTREFTVDRGHGAESMLAVYVPTNHLYLGDIVICERDHATFPDISVEEGIRIFLTGGTALPARVRGVRGDDRVKDFRV